MAELTAIQKTLLENIADLHEIPAGAYNIRSNGGMLGRNTTANIDIVTKTDKPGIDIIIKPGTKEGYLLTSDFMSGAWIYSFEALAEGK